MLFQVFVTDKRLNSTIHLAFYVSIVDWYITALISNISITLQFSRWYSNIIFSQVKINAIHKALKKKCREESKMWCKLINARWFPVLWMVSRPDVKPSASSFLWPWGESVWGQSYHTLNDRLERWEEPRSWIMPFNFRDKQNSDSGHISVLHLLRLFLLLENL